KLELDIEKPDGWTSDNLKDLAILLRKITKPMIIACNKVDVSCGKQNFDKLKDDFPDIILIPVSSESELALREAAKLSLIKYIPGEKSFNIKEPSEMNDKQIAALKFIQESVLNQFEFGTGVQETINQAVFNLIKYIAVYPGGATLQDKDGNVIPDCFLMPPNSTALDFAYRIHTDLGKGFIRAKDIKKKLTVGKEHLLNNSDVIEIISSK
ncbi:TGS domain-containing protein, partial [archaeon]|nr:TGS domain-containing protein [archaeon]